MTLLRPSLRAILALGLAALLAPPARAQNHFLAVSEIVGGTNGRGEVAIYGQDSSGNLTSTTPVATITSQSALAYPTGLATYTDPSVANGGDGHVHLYIAGLDSGIINFDVTANTITTKTNTGGIHYDLNGMVVSGNTLYVSAFDAGTAAHPGGVLEYNLSLNGAITGLLTTAGGVNSGLIGPTGLAANSGGVFVNSSQTNQLYQIFGNSVTNLSLTSGTTPSAAAGMVFTTSGLIETNFFSDFKASTATAGLALYAVGGSTYAETSSTTTAGYKNPTLGGPAGVVLGPGSNQLFVSDYGDGKIYQYAIGGGGTFFSTPTTYLGGGGATGPALVGPTYLAEFTNSGGVTFTGHAVPEPSSVALLGLGAVGGLVARRRLRRAKAAG